jgi:hypothetical protein
MRLLIAHPPGQRQVGAQHHLLEPRIALNLAGDVADDPAQISPELLQRAVGALELLGMGTALM